MKLSSAQLFLTYAMIMFLVGSIFSVGFSYLLAYAAVSDIGKVEVDDTSPRPGDSITISGVIDNANDNENVDITIFKSGGGSDSADTQINGDNGDYSVNYEIPTSADDGIYKIKVAFASEEARYGYFLIDEDNDDAPTQTDENSYQAGQTVTISGTVDNHRTGIDEVDIRVLDPTGDDIGSGQVNLDTSDNTFEDSFRLSSSAEPGLYAVIVEYDGNEAGWAIFEVLGDSGNNDMTAQFSRTSYAPGDEVTITGSIDYRDVEQGVEVLLDVRDPGAVRVASDSVEPDNNGDFEFRFNLDDATDTGTYKATLKYTGYNDKIISFTVSSSTSGGSTSGSGSNAGLTAKLSDTSLLAGEILTVTGVVPRIITDEPVNIVVLAPTGQFVGVSSFPDPESDKSYSATLRLPATLQEDDHYSVVISYDNKDVKILFDITGKVSGSTGGPITVETDRTSYAVGSTVRISGDIAEDTFREGELIALQVYNPDKAPYRFDPITPGSDGSYSYSMVVGGPLGVTGNWQVKVTYVGQVAETNFDLTGGVPSHPGYNLIVADKTYRIEYQSDGTIKSMFVRPAEKMFVVSIDATQDGTLTIVLPRAVIDAVQGSSDIKYVVVTSDIDTGAENTIDVTESSTTGESRTLVIHYDGGTDLIQIQGTTVVPEFGALSAIVLAIAILSIAVAVRFSSRFNTIRFW